MTLAAYFLHDSVPIEALVRSIRLREGLSELFDCWVEVVCEDPDLDLASMIWSTAAVQLGDPGFPATDPEHWRYVHGAIEEARYVAPLGDWHRYSFRLRPSVHGLAYRVRTRIFQQKTVIDVIRQVLEDAGIDMDSIVFDCDPGPERDYVTQWKESELHFMERWLQELGIHYWFEHTEVDHTMHISDKAGTHDPIEGAPELEVHSRDDSAGGVSDQGSIHHVSYTTHFGHDRWASRDWQFKTPNEPRQAEEGEGGQELYEYPGFYETDEMGGGLAPIRMQEIVAGQTILAGRSDCRRLLPGRWFSLVGVDPDALVNQYLLTRQELSVARDDPHSGQFVYDARFTAIPVEHPFRPTRTLHRPVVHGKESAVVTAPAGEEIHVDDMGRIKVHFYWDREQPVDDTASCWVRTQQQNTAGAMFLPRVGWEVDIGFLNGDPDRPVMLQKLYNDEQKPPYDLPGNLMQSSLRTSSSPGGGGTNELRLNDANGSQSFFMHAQKDFDNTVGNDASTTVGVDVQTQVAANAVHQVSGAETITIGGNQDVSVTGRLTVQCAASQSVTVGGLDDWGVSALHSMTTHGSRTDDIGGLLNVLAANGIADTFNASHSLTVGGALSFAAVGGLSETVAGGKTEAIGGAKMEVIKASKSENVKVGKILNSGAVKIDAGTDVSVSAGAALGIRVGGAYTSKCGGDFGISGMAVTMKLSSLEMKAGGSTVTASSGSIELKASNLGGEGVKILLKGDVHYK
ncbi:MAG: type VI secretion system tip protein VgrG [Myxococcales bacterium]|nr:type VI secretion system tip protein VgrG [Myxococcales bacterium]